MGGKERNYSYFGTILKALREGFKSKVPGVTLTTKGLIERFGIAGYRSPNVASINEIEHGVSLPRDLEQLLEAAPSALAATEQEMTELRAGAGLDVWENRFGAEGADRVWDAMRAMGGPSGVRRRHAQLSKE